MESLASILVPLAPVTPPGELGDVIRGACLEAAGAILDAAFADFPAEGTDPVDVMSSTAVLGVARGNELTLASVGDSRAYLLHGGVAEQLTVDGDVRCARLAAGMPPELVRELGPEALALYSCLGIGEPGPGGRFVPSGERSEPHVGRWKLLPGDVVVLCTDGLVEEGVFLEPGELAALLSGRADRPARELAEMLVAAAKGRHRDPSAEEPDGCGDDVTCVVVVVRGG